LGKLGALEEIAQCDVRERGSEDEKKAEGGRSLYAVWRRGWGRTRLMRGYLGPERGSGGLLDGGTTFPRATTASSDRGLLRGTKNGFKGTSVK